MRQIVQTSQAPDAIGPYSQAIIANGFVFTSGQIPIDPATGQFVSGGIAEQTQQVLKNLSAVLEAAGSNLNRVVKTTVFLADMQDFTAMNEVYATFLEANRRRVQRFRLARLPKDARVEIDVVALAGE